MIFRIKKLNPILKKFHLSFSSIVLYKLGRIFVKKYQELEKRIDLLLVGEKKVLRRKFYKNIH